MSVVELSRCTLNTQIGLVYRQNNLEGAGSAFFLSKVKWYLGSMGLKRDRIIPSGSIRLFTTESVLLTNTSDTDQRVVPGPVHR